MKSKTLQEKKLNPAAAFGHVLRYFRISSRLSQERLAQESGLDRSYISLLERGIKQPSLTTIIQIAQTLDLSPRELMAKVEEKLRENSKD
ncbi:MAG: helix-turn-helix domain-containing protein [Desulfobacteraceae bacterium]|nr:helix-turn-helix domain-containing protein [Desulfobacteraceae bacterium]MCF8095166.1 helix-turn-helix domain-containing protein [Desulfobacteraceae bacterium]